MSQCRTLRGNELRGVDEGVRGEEGGVVCSAQHYWNCVELQSIESLLCNVITTNSVLEADVKSKNIPSSLSSHSYTAVTSETTETLILH